MYLWYFWELKPCCFAFRLYVWEILHSTIRKMNKHVQKIQKELEDVKARLDKQQHKKVGEVAMFVVASCSPIVLGW